jgi:hypothetical protein
MGRYGLDWRSSGYGQVADACEWGNEPLGSIICSGSWPPEELLASQGLCCLELARRLYKSFGWRFYWSFGTENQYQYLRIQREAAANFAAGGMVAPWRNTKEKVGVFRLRSEMSSSGHFHRHPYAMLDYIRHGITIDFSWHIRSSPVVIINLQNYSPFPIPSCWKPVDGCPTPVHVFSCCGEVRTFLRILRKSTFYELEKAGTLGAPNRILRDTKAQLFMPHKTVTVPGKLDKWNL